MKQIIELSKEHRNQIVAMVDASSTKSVLKEELIPTQFGQKLAISIRITQFNTSLVYLTHHINNIPIKIKRQQFTLLLAFLFRPRLGARPLLPSLRTPSAQRFLESCQYDHIHFYFIFGLISICFRFRVFENITRRIYVCTSINNNITFFKKG